MPGERLIHYIRGRLSGNSIAFASDQPRFDNLGILPSVVLLNNGYVISVFLRVHDPIYGNTYHELIYRLSMEDPNDPVRLNWLSDAGMWRSYTLGETGLASNGNYMIAVPRDNYLRYTWGIAP